MDLRLDLSSGLTYVGAANGARQQYHVFSSADAFIVFSFSKLKPGSGNFNLIPMASVEYVYRCFSGERNVTSKDVVDRAKRTKHVKDSLAALNILYVLIAQGRAAVTSQGAHSKLFLEVYKPTDAVVRSIPKKKIRNGERKKRSTTKVARSTKEKSSKHAVRKVHASKAPVKASRPKMPRNGLEKMVHKGKTYTRYLVETFDATGEASRSKVRVRPLPGQGVRTSLRVKCGKPFRKKFPVGSRFLMWTTPSSKNGGTPCLYAPYNWKPEKV